MLSINNLSCRYDKTPVLNNLSFELEAGELACILGPSGCGKTTLLRCLAGFEPITSGSIIINDQPIETSLPEHRGLGMVFQDYSLFPHLSVIENIGFGIRKWQKQERESRIEDMLELTGLGPLQSRFPTELSGGQQQRVALARALAPKPALVLMDEPFSNLDLQLRRHLGTEIREVLKDQGITAIMVTHDQEEAFSIADKVGLLKNGNLQQWQTPEQVYHFPASPWIAEFVGQVSWLSGKVTESGTAITQLGTVELANPDVISGQEVQIALRPEDLIIDIECAERNAKVIDCKFKGNRFLNQIHLTNGEVILAESSNRLVLKIKQEINVSLKPYKYQGFKA